MLNPNKYTVAVRILVDVVIGVSNAMAWRAIVVRDSVGEMLHVAVGLSTNVGGFGLL